MIGLVYTELNHISMLESVFVYRKNRKIEPRAKMFLPWIVGSKLALSVRNGAFANY